MHPRALLPASYPQPLQALLLLLLALAGPGGPLTPARGAAREAMEIPAFTAYLLPDPEGARVSEPRGITGWSNPGLQIAWFGDFRSAGELDASVRLRLPENKEGRYRLTVAGHPLEASVTGAGTNPVTVVFGRTTLTVPGHHRILLESLSPPGSPQGEIEALLLSGAATNRVHFNLKERRNAASVHLMYPTPPGTNVSAFYCELTAVEDPVHTYYMACGWHRGYFGMQVNSRTERRIIFSVWDSGKEALDRRRVAATNRVSLVAKGEGVDAGDFGNEGTGGHSHLVYPWKTGERQRFLVTAKPVDSTHTVYSGFYFHPERKEWVLISSWRAPRDGGWLRGLYSFSENFGGSTGHLVRKVRSGNQWIRTDGGAWIELTAATFSHDPTGRADRLDRFMGLEGGEFFLSHGGFIPGHSLYGERFERPPTGRAPSDLKLPELPAP
ncbi:MAG TPA: hypothetical protein DCM86_18115 [Verrucomicrobiales bacterium]|nr:hypothetical protein [Verrucomicrobiales bacterium]